MLIKNLLALHSPLLRQWLAFLVLPALLLWSFIVFDLNRLHKQSVSLGQTQTQNLAKIYSEEVTSSIKLIDYVVMELRDQWKNDPIEFGALVQRRQVFLDPSVAFHVSIVGADGKIVFSSMEPLHKPLDVNDREHFRHHRFGTVDELFISEPLIGRITSRWMIQFPRPLRTASGRFNGIIAVAVSPEYFSRFHKSIDLGADSSISLVRHDGKVISRHPNAQLALGNVIANVPFLKPGAPDSGSYRKISDFDQVERFYSWRTVERGDLLVVVGQSTQSLFQQYEQLRTVYLWSGAAATFLLMLVASFMLKNFRKQQKNAATMAAMEKALQRSQKLEAVGRLTGGVAHDFNNMLQIISGNMQMLESACGENEHVATRIKNTLEAVDRGAKLSSQLLTFARRQPLQTGIFHIGNRLKRIEGLIQRLVGEAIAIHIGFPDDLWNTKIDPDLFDNVIMNLAVNARDAMNGKGTISFRLENAVVTGADRKTHPEMEKGEYVLLMVADTGSGMAPEVMERAFEPFFTTKPEGAGTGLGLSMAYGFVKQSSGFIYLASKQERGTEVRIFLPRTSDQLNHSPEAAPKRSVGGNESILVVEDNLQVQSTVSSLLSQLGYRVLAADDAEQALQILKQNKSIDILFTDIVLQGGMDGLELGAHAKAMYPGLHILLTSGYFYDSLRNKERLDQNIHVLKKPYKREQLDAAIQELLHKVRAEEGHRVSAHMD